MTSNRSYRGARPVTEAIAELRKCAGQQFDPAFVDAFVAAIERDGWTGPQPIALHMPPGPRGRRYRRTSLRRRKRTASPGRACWIAGNVADITETVPWPTVAGQRY